MENNVLFGSCYFFLDKYVISETSDFFIENSFLLELYTFLWTNVLPFELIVILPWINYVFFETSDFFENNCCNLYNLLLFHVTFS